MKVNMVTWILRKKWPPWKILCASRNIGGFKRFGPLDICVLPQLFFSLYLELLYLKQNQFFATISLSISKFIRSKLKGKWNKDVRYLKIQK